MTTSDGAIVVGGVDCHSRVHHAVALDQTGRRLGDRAFPATGAGYADLLGWLRRFGAVAAVGVESTGSYGAALTRSLLQAGVRVVEVNQVVLATARAVSESIVKGISDEMNRASAPQGYAPPGGYGAARPKPGAPLVLSRQL